MATPVGVALGPDGHLYVVDAGSALTHEFSVDGTLLDSWSTDADDEGASYHQPAGMAIGPDGSVYVADAAGARMRQFDADGNHLRDWGAFGDGPGEFEDLGGVASGDDGSIYVTDPQLGRVQRFDADGELVAAWATDQLAPGEPSNPRGVAVKDGIVYVTETDQQSVLRYELDGDFVGSWSADPQPGVDYSSPSAIAVDGLGSVYVADATNNRVLQYSTSGALRASWDHDDLSSLPLNTPGFGFISGIAADDTGNVFLVDLGFVFHEIPAYVHHFARVPRPDLRARRLPAGRWYDNDVYRTPSGLQVIAFAAELSGGRSATFTFSVQNDAPVPDQITLRLRERRLVRGGPGYVSGPANLFLTSYTIGGAARKASLLAGTYTTPVLDPGEQISVTARVTARNPKVFQSKIRIDLQARSAADPDRQDIIWGAVY